MNRIRFDIALFFIGLLAFTGWAVLAQDTSTVPQISVEFSADGVTIPEALPEGIVNITFTNNTDAPVGPILARLNPDVTVESFNEALSQGPMAAVMMVSLLGGTEIAPNTSKDITFDFSAGTNVLLEMNSEVPSVEFFEVADTEGEGAAAPEAAVHVSLLDFAFALPLEITAGPQTWMLENQGTQWHEMAIARVDDNMTISQFRDFVKKAAAGEIDEQEGGELIFFAPLSQGERAWTTIDLEPGTYVVACFLPDFASGHAHADMGMVQIISVIE